MQVHDKRLWKLHKGASIPLYQQIKELILNHIQTGRLQPGSALPSYPWLSRTLGVADKTVRQAYTALQQAGVLTIQRGRGTFVAALPDQPGAGARGKTGIIGILPPPLPVQLSQDAFFWRAMRAIQEAAFSAHLDTLLLSRAGDLRTVGVAERLADPKRLDGLIALSVPPDAFLQRLAALRRPLLLAGVHAPGVPCHSVVFEQAGAAREVTYRLIGLGHRRIGYVGLARGQDAAELEAGFRHAQGSAGLPIAPEWVVRVDVDLGESGQSAIDALLAEEITAVLTCRGALAQTVCERAARRGLSVPGDLSIAGIVTAGTWMLPGNVPLEAAVLDVRELGRRAVQRIAELIAGTDPVPRKEFIEPLHLEGQSIAPPGKEELGGDAPPEGPDSA